MDLEQKAIERLQKASEISMKLFGQPLVVTYSGGKDSDVVLQIAKNAKIPFEVLHNLTTADAPETVYHIRNVFRELELDGIKCTVDKPVYKGKRTSVWNLIPQKSMPPTRIVRYCCAVLKEKGGTGRFIGCMTHNTGAFRSGENGLLYLRTSEDSAQQTSCLTLNCGEKPGEEIKTRISEILEQNPDEKYKLSARACQGILNRAEKRGKKLLEQLEAALMETILADAEANAIPVEFKVVE